MSMSTAFKKLQASNCKVYKVRPFHRHMPYAWVSMSLEMKVHTKVRNQEKAPTRDNWL